MKKNAALGLLLGLFVSAGAFVVIAILDDTIKTEEDVEKYLGLSTLTSVPDRKDYLMKRNMEKRKKVRRGENNGTESRNNRYQKKGLFLRRSN